MRGSSRWRPFCWRSCPPGRTDSRSRAWAWAGSESRKSADGWAEWSRQTPTIRGGQQQQLAIARALLGKPRLLLLDEPTEGIQPSVVLDIQRAVGRILRETGIGVLLVEHHPSFVRQSDWYYAMQKGGVVASGPTADLSQEMLQRFLSV